MSELAVASDVQHKAALWDSRREIDALRAERDRLRAALEAIAVWRPDGAIPNWKIVLDGDAARAMQAHARAALDDTEPAA